METDDKYEKLITRLKKSVPVLDDPDSIKENVLREIRTGRGEGRLPALFAEMFFGWIYVGWLRRSLITVAAAVILIFGYQQILIIRKINELSAQRIENGSVVSTSISDDISSRLMYYRITGKGLPGEKIDVSEEEIDKLIIEINRLKLKYEDLINLIGNDPELKEYFENRLDQEIIK